MLCLFLLVDMLTPPQKQAELVAIFTNDRSTRYRELQDLLHHYILVVKPFVISLWSLEATRATVSDVFAAWLAIGAYIQDLQDDYLGDNIHGLPEKLIEQVIAIYNFRVQPIFANDLYFVGFCLDPGLWFLLTLDHQALTLPQRSNTLMFFVLPFHPPLPLLAHPRPFLPLLFLQPWSGSNTCSAGS
jgi:hypothetical protein